MVNTVNRKWAIGIGADGQPIYAPRYAIVVNGRTVYNPTDKHYRLAGYQSVVETPPSDSTAEGYHYEPRGWEERDGAILRVYEQVANPPPAPRVFSKLKCVAALMSAGVWPQVKAFVEQAGLYDLYLAAQDFAEDNAYFTQGRAALQSALGWSDEQVEAVLAQCIAEGV